MVSELYGAHNSFFGPFFFFFFFFFSFFNFQTNIHLYVLLKIFIYKNFVTNHERHDIFYIQDSSIENER